MLLLQRLNIKKKPVHINCPSILKFDNIEKTLPSDIWSTNLFYDCDVNLKEYLRNKTVAVFVGSHNKFTRDETQALSISQSAGIFRLYAIIRQIIWVKIKFLHRK